MATIQLPPDFKEFLKLLNSKDVKYLIVGGYAVGYHGYPRATGDIDIWIESVADNANRLVDTLQEFGFKSPDLSPSIFLEYDKIIRMGEPPIRIELFTSLPGVKFAECYENRTRDTIDEIQVNIISLKDLRLNKKASARHKDLNDLENLPE